ncbi:hypothetical protein AB0C12_17935 [Actinoplanes sp. NPDC048967]|uniref:hypothetical protein n=1 Tax=Actinoplanes sp. NPDC048967 TaxID=3155269 RepID=UPI0033CCB669
MNLRESVDDYAELDTQLQRADSAALATLERLLDVESILAIAKAAAAEKGAASEQRGNQPA